ncbi:MULTISPECIES: phosphate ABC transporter substrate-binding/OmpA family protein [unclassified Yoonia]|uniref:phosphate ABC transporter substrate-binding/OmpA family protein n=1 Tax=unclassified Yoonia TaxID=2629118 RepID=UPI002AFF70D8|nr:MULTISPECIES: phosphate ABC transporter substrate-binding/OmpA family protein [unclassified Yoonia]
MREFRQKLALATCLVATPLIANAQEVTISSKDNAVTISGTLVSFDDEIFVLDTDIGQLRLSRLATNCAGEACPQMSVNLDLNVAVTEAQTASLLQALVNGFASTRSLSGLSVPDDQGVVARIDMLDTQTNSAAGAVNVAVRDADDAFVQLVQDQIDVALTKVPVPVAIAQTVVAAGGTDLRDVSRERIVALDALVPIVHPTNSVRSVSLEDLALVASGRITNWSELGGDNAPIRMVLPAEGSSVDTAFSELVLDPNRARVRASAERVNDDSDAAAAVMADPTAIAIATVSETGSAEVLPIRQSCGPLAYATDFAIKAEEYPLSRRVYAYTGDDDLTSTQTSFLNFMTSPAAQPLIQSVGYVDQSVVAQPISLQGTRMTSAILSASTGATLAAVQNLSRELATAERLSTTFRFATGSANLDNKALEDVQRMVDFLNSPAARNRDILIIGFTDDVGRFDLNERLALLRAGSVRDALVTALGGDVLAGRTSVASYGPLAPVGCNDTADGRESNRRVEVWLR